MTTMVLPQELVTEILSCLPVKSLLRLKCACTSWYLLINSPSFINLHLRKGAALKLKGNHNYTILTESTNPFPNPDPPRFSLVSGDTLHPIRDVMLPYIDEFGFFASSPYNGLFCLFGRENELHGYSDNFALWNPATRKLEILPECPFPLRRYHVVGFGFGAIGSDSDYDYKVVKIVCVYDSDCQCEAYVYSSKTNCWTEVSDVPPEVTSARRDCCAAYHNGSYYWLIPYYYTDSLLSFDMHSHVFHVSNLPLALPDGHKPWMVNFDVQDDSLAMVVHFKEEAIQSTENYINVYTNNDGQRLTGSYEIWVRDEVSKTWFHQPRVKNYSFMRRRVCINDTIVGYDGDHLVSYNLESHEQKRIRVYYGGYGLDGRLFSVVFHGSEGHPFTIVPFIESLVSVNTGESLPEESLPKKSVTKVELDDGIREMVLESEEEEGGNGA